MPKFPATTVIPFLSYVILFALSPLLIPTVSAQDEGPSIDEVQEAYEQLQFELVEERAEDALAQYERYRPEEIVRLHTLLGIVNFAQNEQLLAREHFQAALSLAPGLTLDARLVSPKVREFYQTVKREWLSSQRRSITGEAGVRYILLQDPRPAAAWRSLLVPGWGHLYLDEPEKGWLLVGSFTGSVAGAWLAHHWQDSGPNTEQINWGRVRNGLLLSAAGLWIYSYVDVVHLWRPSMPPQFGAAIGATPSANGAPIIHFSMQF